MGAKDLLSEAGIIYGSAVTYAALILLGKRNSLSVHLADTEVQYEYRPNGGSNIIRKAAFHDAFFLYFERLWNEIDSRNVDYTYMDGPIQRSVPLFNYRAIREAILSAICHRDYTVARTVRVLQLADRLEVVSPGGLPSGVTLDNILERNDPRNPLIARVLKMCGYVEKWGQGMDIMFSEAIREGKLKPNFSKTGLDTVWVVLNGLVQNADFVVFLNRAERQVNIKFDVYDLLTLDAISSNHRQATLLPDEQYQHSIEKLLRAGLIEQVGRSAKYVLAKRYYEINNNRPEYTRRKGLRLDQNMMLILNHLEDFKSATLQDFVKLLAPYNKSRDEVKRILVRLRVEGRITFVGGTRNGYWELAPTNGQPSAEPLAEPLTAKKPTVKPKGEAEAANQLPLKLDVDQQNS